MAIPGARQSVSLWKMPCMASGAAQKGVIPVAVTTKMFFPAAELMPKSIRMLSGIVRDKIGGLEILAADGGGVIRFGIPGATLRKHLRLMMRFCLPQNSPVPAV